LHPLDLLDRHSSPSGYSISQVILSEFNSRDIYDFDWHGSDLWITVSGCRIVKLRGIEFLMNKYTGVRDSVSITKAYIVLSLWNF
jgi:hypothetical protein